MNVNLPPGTATFNFVMRGCCCIDLHCGKIINLNQVMAARYTKHSFVNDVIAPHGKRLIVAQIIGLHKVHSKKGCISYLLRSYWDILSGLGKLINISIEFITRNQLLMHDYMRLRESEEIFLDFYNKPTLLQSRVAMLLKRREGRANLEVKKFKPLAWVLVIQPVLPVMYPSNMIVKHCTIAGYRLVKASPDGLFGVDELETKRPNSIS